MANSYCLYASLPKDITQSIQNAHDELSKTPDLLASSWWEVPHITVIYGIKNDKKIDVSNLDGLQENFNEITGNFVTKYKKLKQIKTNVGSIGIRVREKCIILYLTIESNILNDIAHDFREQKIGSFDYKCNEFHATLGVIKNTPEGIIKALEIANKYRPELEERIINLPSLQFVDNDDKVYDIIALDN